MLLVTELNFWSVTRGRKPDYTEPVSSVLGQA